MCIYLYLCILNLEKLANCPLIAKYTVEPPNKGHVGDNKNSAVLSFIERLSSLEVLKILY